MSNCHGKLLPDPLQYPSESKALTNPLYLQATFADFFAPLPPQLSLMVLSSTGFAMVTLWSLFASNSANHLKFVGPFPAAMISGLSIKGRPTVRVGPLLAIKKLRDVFAPISCGIMRGFQPPSSDVYGSEFLAL